MNRNMAAILWAHSARGITPTAYRVLVCLAERVNSKRSDWEVWPSQHKLADRAEVSVPTLRRHLDELEEKGFIAREQMKRQSGAKSVCLYRLNVALTLTQPDGTQQDFDGEDDDQIERSDGRGIERRLSMACKAVFPSSEPLKERTSERDEDSPLPPRGQDDHDTDLFKVPAVIALSPIEVADEFITRWQILAATAPRLQQTMRAGPVFSQDVSRRMREACGSTEEAKISPVLDELFRHIAASAWLRGEGGKGWVPAPGWFVKKQNFGKVMEGYYGNDAAAGGAADRSSRGGSYLDIGRQAVETMRAGRRGSERSAREVAGLPPRGSARDYR